MTEAVQWIKWRFDKWRGDLGLRTCGLAARGLWIELLAVIHESEKYGHLLVKGRQPSAKQIASMVGMTTEREVVALLTELEEAGVFSRTEDGAIYSRRMVRDNVAREKGKVNGAKGGNPNLIGRGDEGVEEGVNPQANPQANPTLQSEGKIESERESEKESITAAPASRPGLAEDNVLELRGGGKPADKRGSRLSRDWTPTEKSWDYCVKQGVDPQLVLEEFCSYWPAVPGLKGLKLDWELTFLGRVREVARQGKFRLRGCPPPGGKVNLGL
jgi:hypothetical protein